VDAAEEEREWAADKRGGAVLGVRVRWATERPPFTGRCGVVQIRARGALLEAPSRRRGQGAARGRAQGEGGGAGPRPETAAEPAGEKQGRPRGGRGKD
jgi:hypothetical protein